THRDLHSFPTRRSSGLKPTLLSPVAIQREQVIAGDVGNVVGAGAVVPFAVIANVAGAFFHAAAEQGFADAANVAPFVRTFLGGRSEEHTSELQSRSDLV